MPTYVALLRGINVNGRRTLKMEDLRAAAVAIGLGGARTYIQSGNVIGCSDEPGDALAQRLAQAIADRFALDVDVITLTSGELAEVVADNPFLARGADPRTLYVTLLQRIPDPERLEGIDRARHLPDAFVVRGPRVYVHCPNGYHATKLTNAFFESRFGAPATTRNWNTMVKLAGLAAR